jgi:mannose-6-phosphate isomerase-like protein (cupin superfamily)
VALYRASAEIPVATFDMQTASFTTSLIHGSSASLMLAERPAGYHSRPHVHDCEQINLLQAGELHVFCDTRAFLLRPGDALRIPPNAVHWSWNRGESPCVLFEVHAPGLQDDPQTRSFAVSLFDDGEDEETSGRPTNVFVDLPSEEIDRIEALTAWPGVA